MFYRPIFNACFVMKNDHPVSFVRQTMVRTEVALLVAATVTLFAFSGCRQPVGNSPSGGSSVFGFNSASPYTNNGMAQNPGSQQVAAMANDVQRLNQRLGAFDSDNQLLNTEIASLKQKLQISNQYSQTLKQQLADTSNRYQQSELARQSAVQQLAMARQNPSSQTQGQLAGYGGTSAPTRFAGGATIRANNSLMQRVSEIQIPGGQARMDGDVIRIEFPSDRMFVPGSYQIQPTQIPVLQNVAATIRQKFPKQIVGIEAHWDNTPLNPPSTTHQQLTATQALSIFENLVRFGLPQSQMFTMAMASNRPRHAQGMAGGVSPNRRIELVIYPETFDGS